MDGVDNETMAEPETVEINSEAAVQEHSQHYTKLLDIGLAPAVANTLDSVLKDELVQFEDIDEKVYNALKENDECFAQIVIKQFRESDLQEVENKGEYLYEKIKDRQEKIEQAKENPEEIKAPSEEKIKALLERTKYSLDVSMGQRKYGGPPPPEVYDGPEPGQGCQVYISRIPRTVYEYEIIPLLEQVGTVWDFTLMMDPLTGQNRGYGYANFTTKEAAEKCVEKFHHHEIRPLKFLTMREPESHTRLYVGAIPKSKTKEDILAEFGELTTGLKDVNLKLHSKVKTKNRGFCFLEYNDHTSASQARRKLSAPDLKVFETKITVDWCNPIDKPSEEIMQKIKVLYVKNLAEGATEEVILKKFGEFGEIEKVTKTNDYAFVYFKDLENAKKAREELDGKDLEGKPISINLAEPLHKRKKRERRKDSKKANSKKVERKDNNRKGARRNQRGGSASRGRGMARGNNAARRGYGGYGNNYYPEREMDYGYDSQAPFDGYGYTPPFNPFGAFPPRRPRLPPPPPRLPTPMMRGARGMRPPRFPAARGFPPPPAAQFNLRGARPPRGRGGFAMKRKDFDTSYGGKRGNFAGAFY